jgi:hypothetical protein
MYATQFKIPRMSHNTVELPAAIPSQTVDRLPQSQQRPEVPASSQPPSAQGWTEIYEWLDTIDEGFRSGRACPSLAAARITTICNDTIYLFNCLLAYTPRGFFFVVLY